MEKKGYIVRVSVPTDARLKQILLTNQGEDLYDEFRDHIQTMEKLLVQGMTEEEIDQLIFLLGKIRKSDDIMIKREQSVPFQAEGLFFFYRKRFS